MSVAIAGCAGALVAVTCNAVWSRLRRLAFSKVADRDSGEQRRKVCPPHLEISSFYLDGCYEFETAKSKKLHNERRFLTLQDGTNIFFQSWEPPSGEVKAVMVFIHGFGDHSDFQMALKAKTLCNLGPFAAVGFDLPGHGRSDGAHVHIPDWHAFCDAAREVVVEHVRPLIQKKWPGAKMFGLGESMGGGVLFTLLARERELFQGAVLICPMLFVSRDMFPPWMVVQVLKHVVSPMLPLWPITPGPELGDLLNKDPKMKKLFMEDAVQHSAISYRAKARLGTALELAFKSGEWMQSRIPEFDAPTLIMHGGGDVVTDHRVSRELFEKMKHPDKELIFPDGVWHGDLFHGGPTMYDATRERFEAVANWVLKRC